VIVAGGLVVSALHSGHEAGWIVSMQSEAVDLTWLAPPGSIRASLLTGVLGLQPTLTAGEALSWAVYVVPMTLFVLWPSRPRRASTPPVTLERSAA
jgi:high-affinity iron transporter